MSGKFTPGPWVVVAMPFCDRIEDTSADHACIAETGSWLDHEKTEQHANARLIASAPAMHAALEKAEAALRAVDTAPIEYADAMFWQQVSEARTAIETALALSPQSEDLKS